MLLRDGGMRRGRRKKPPSTDAFQPPVLRMRGAGGTTRAQHKETRDDAKEQGCGDLRSRRRSRQRCRTRLCARGGHAVSHRATPGARRSCRQGSSFRRRTRRAAEVDALDEQAVDRHLQSVIDKAGRVDISFHAIGIESNTTLQGVPVVALAVEQFSLPIATDTRSSFLTARLAARRMVAKRSGVIMTVTSIPSRTGLPLLGGVAPAMSAVEALTRISPPNSHRTAFAWWVCDRRGCRSRARSRKSSGFTPRHGEFRGNSSMR